MAAILLILRSHRGCHLAKLSTTTLMVLIRVPASAHLPPPLSLSIGLRHPLNLSVVATIPRRLAKIFATATHHQPFCCPGILPAPVRPPPPPHEHESRGSRAGALCCRPSHHQHRHPQQRRAQQPQLG
jgi:hypothetical protein